MPWLAVRLQQEVLGQLAFAGIDALDLADFFDQEAQGDVDHRAVKGGAADAGGKGDVADLAQQSAGERSRASGWRAPGATGGTCRALRRSRLAVRP